MKLRTPKGPKFMPVRVTRMIVGNGWRIEDGDGVDEAIRPSEWLKYAMLGGTTKLFLARRSADADCGWEFKPFKGKPVYW